MKEVSEKSLVDAHAALLADVSCIINPNIMYLTEATELFGNHFRNLGYKVEPTVKITAKLDPTVRFIGAPISVLKPYFMNKNIGVPGRLMVQNCIRTRNLKILHDIDSMPKYGSFFTGMCVLVPYERLKGLCIETLDFLQNKLGLSKAEICINICSKDRDLQLAVKDLLPKESVNIDTKPDTYYRHKYGIDGVHGRNFNLAIRNVKTGNFEDIGNVIVIESDKERLGVELALGDTTIVQQLLGLSHVQDNYALNLPLANAVANKKMEDAIMVCLALYGEGLRPNNASSTQSRILRSYAKTISLFRQLCHIDIEDLRILIKRIEDGHLPFRTLGCTNEIIDWIENYEKRISTDSINIEDAKIAKILESNYNLS